MVSKPRYAIGEVAPLPDALVYELGPEVYGNGGRLALLLKEYGQIDLADRIEQADLLTKPTVGIDLLQMAVEAEKVPTAVAKAAAAMVNALIAAQDGGRQSARENLTHAAVLMRETRAQLVTLAWIDPRNDATVRSGTIEQLAQVLPVYEAAGHSLRGVSQGQNGRLVSRPWSIMRHYSTKVSVVTVDSTLGPIEWAYRSGPFGRSS